MSKLFVLILIFILNIPIESLVAQQTYYTNYTMNNGLSANRVYSILQDSKGFMWFGTDDGLSRFDGLNFKNYYLSDYIDATTSNSVRKLFIDKHEKLWIGLDNGLVVFDPRTEEFRRFTASTATGETIDSYVSDIMEDKEGELWIATYGKGLYRYTKGEKDTLLVYKNNQKNSNSIVQDLIMTIAADQQGTIWIGSYSEGISCFNKENSQFTSYKQSSESGGLSDNYIQKIYVDALGNLWIGTFQNGIDRFNYANRTFVNYRYNKPGNRLYHIHDLKENAEGELLIASDNGLFFLQTKTGHITDLHDSAYKQGYNAPKFVYSVFLDKEQSVWLGTYHDGVNFYSLFQNNFSHYSCGVDASIGKVVNVIEPSLSDNYWIGTDNNGIFKFESGTGQVAGFRTARDIGESYYCIHDMLEVDNQLFVATYGRGLEVINLKTGRVTQYLHNSHDSLSLPSSRIYKIYKASNDRMYLGTSNGLCFFDQIKNQFFSIHGIQGRITAIVEDRFGKLWVGTSTEGLYKYDLQTEEIVSYTQSDALNSLTKNVITTLAIDGKGRLWIGTHGQGLCLYNYASNDFKRYDKLPLPNMIIASITPQGACLWLGTNKGLAVFDPEQETVKVYSQSNGLYNEQFTPNANYMGEDGRFFLGSADGFYSFYSQNIKENTYDPSIVLTQMRIMGNETLPGKDSPLKESIIFTKEITLDHTQNFIGFDFASLSYVAPQQLAYKYLLEGVDQEWQYAKGHNNQMSYANLPSGKYQLKVVGTNSDQLWSSKELSLMINVLPPFYKTPLAYLLYLLFFLFILFILSREYMQMIDKRHRRRLQALDQEQEIKLYNAKIDFFTHVAHEIRTPLSLISGPLEQLTRNKEADSERCGYLAMIEANYQRLYALITQLLDFRKVDTGLYNATYNTYLIRSLLSKVTDLFKYTAQQNGLVINTAKVSPDLMIYTDEEAFVKIMTNLVSNAVKYAQHSIDIEALQIDQMIRVAVTDDGPGIIDSEKEKIFEAFYQINSETADSKNGIGIGLNMTRSLVHLLHGSIIAKDREDKKSGVSIEVLLPVTNKEANTQELVEASTTDRSYTILVVDDNLEILNFISMFLSDTYRVVVAQSGSEALDVIQNQAIDLIVSDVVMSYMSGFDLCRQLKKNDQLSNIPIILLTAKTDTESKIEGLACGADAYIEKPFSSMYLLAQIENLLKKKECVQSLYATKPFADLHIAVQNKQDEEFISKCRDFVLKNIGEPEFSINKLAEEMSISRTSLFAKIKEIMGITPNEFIKLIRLKRACELMVEGNYRITEIVFLVGFSSSSYFAKCFHKQFGILPTDFIKQLNDKNIKI